LIPNLLEGFNVTCFAYGMTGAGKTHTMIGQATSLDENQVHYASNGLCFLAVDAIFRHTRRGGFTVKVSYLEIYNEQVRDLLDDQQQTLMIVEDPMRGVVVPGLSEVVIDHPGSLQQIVVLGNQRRMMAATGANQFSSRSHSILIVSVESQTPNSRGEVIYSKLQMIDLAGSERAAQTENRGQRMVEGANINRSLLALGNCINILSDNMRPPGTFVPYRDSKLTRLLKDSLGGNTKTVMIACVSPST